jgi:hypothetical protein
MVSAWLVPGQVGAKVTPMEDNTDWSGYNDNGSSPTVLDWFKAGSGTATGILGALNKPKTTTTAPGKTNWTVIAGIGAAVLGVLLLLMVVAKK